MQISKVLPIIYTHHIFDTLRFYNALGFDYDYDFNEREQNWSILSWDDAEIMVKHPDEYERDMVRKTNLYIKVVAMDDIYARVKYLMDEVYGNYLTPISTNNDMDHREFQVRDNNGNTVTFAEKL